MGNTINLIGKIPGCHTQKEIIALIKGQLAAGNIVLPSSAIDCLSPTGGLDISRRRHASQADYDKKADTKEEPMASTWEPSRFQDILHQRALDRLNEQAAAIFTDPNAGTTTPALDWQISSMSQNDDPDKELLIKFLEGAETMQLYQAYIIDLKDYAINQYGPVVAKNSSAARDKALTWLVSEAGSTIYADRDIEIFDGDIEHYHIVVQEVSNCIPNKIKEK